MPSYWIVTCPVEQVLQAGSKSARDSLWDRWYTEKCVAVGWGPRRGLSLDGLTDDRAWVYARNRLREMQERDQVVPFLKDWRIGPVGTVVNFKIRDEEWEPTIQPHEAHDRKPHLGRRINVRWETGDMPPDGRAASIPMHLRSRRALALHAIENLTSQRFQELCTILADPSNWTDV